MRERWTPSWLSARIKLIMGVLSHICLRTKLVAAVAGASLLVTAIAGTVYALTAQPAYHKLVVEELGNTFQADVTEYFRQTGSLDGLGPWLHARLAGPAPVPNSAPLLVRFGLANTTGRVILSGDTGYDDGSQVPANVLAQSAPLTIDGKRAGTILVPANAKIVPDQAQLEYAANIRDGLLLAGAIGVSAAVVTGIQLARGIVKPLQRLTTAAQEVAAGKVGQHIPAEGTDELAQLAQAFNSMSDDLARYDQLRRQTAAEMVHELRSPVSVIHTYIEAMREGALSPTTERLDSVSLQVGQLTNLIDGLRLLAVTDVGALPLQCEATDLRQLVEQDLAAHAPRATKVGVVLRGELDSDGLVVDIDSGRMLQVLDILLSNALRHTDKGEIVISCSARNGAAVLCVTDTGGGIEPELLPRVFERFSRGDSARRKDADGFGLGLAIAKLIVEGHGGTISVQSTVGRGTAFEIALPLAGVAQAAGAPELIAAGR